MSEESNKCWNKTGSPPPKGSKKDVLILRSNNSIVIPPASTGSLNTNKNAVTHTLTKKSGMLYHAIDALLRLFIVHRKLRDPAIDLTPARCNLKITMSILLVEWPKIPLRGG